MRTLMLRNVGKVVTFAVFLMVVSSNLRCNNLIFEPVYFEKQPLIYNNNLEKHTRVQRPSKIKSALSLLGKATKASLKFGFNNYDKILSKKFAAAAIIVGAPYLYFSDTAVLELITRYMTDFALKMSSAVTDGILNAMVDNPITLAKLMTILTASQTGKKFAEKAGIKLAEILLTGITLGRYTA